MLWLLLFTLPAQATEWSGQVHAVTDIPFLVGARGQVEGPARLRLNTTLGWMPRPYVNLLNDVVVAFGGYDDLTAELIEAALQNSLVWRTHVGWRPLEAGWFVEAGYGLATLGGGIGAAEVVEAATGQDLGDDTTGFGFDLRTTSHMVDVVSGYEHTWRRLVIRADLGGSFTVGARSTVERQFPAPRRGELADMVEDGAEQYLDDTLKRWAHSPTLGLAVGIRLGPVE